MRTPVGLPWVTSGPVTRLWAVSMVWLGLRSWYRAPCSACGTQGVCTTTGSGHAPLRLMDWLAAAGAAPVPLPLPVQALAASISASATSTIRPWLPVGRMVEAVTVAPSYWLIAGGGCGAPELHQRQLRG